MIERVPCQTSYQPPITLERRNRQGDILRCFGIRGDLRLLIPVAAELANQVQRAGNKNCILRLCRRQGLIQSTLGVRNNRELLRMMAGNLREL